MGNQINFNSIKFGIFIIISLIINNNPQAQFARRRPQQGSFSAAKNQNYGQQIGIGKEIGLSSSLGNSKTVSQTNGGTRNVAKSNSLTQGGNIGNLGISSTVTGTKNRQNGQLSGGGIGHDLNIGGVGLGSSLSTDNLKSIGLHRNSQGGTELGLGLLKFGVSNNGAKQTGGQTGTNAGATGNIAKAKANAASRNTNFGLFDLTSTNSNSKSFGASRNGQTSANAGGSTVLNSRPQQQQQRGPLRTFFGRRKRDLGNSFHLEQNYVRNNIENRKALPCSNPKNCTAKQSEGRTFGLLFDVMNSFFTPTRPAIVPPPPPVPHHPVIHHHPIYPPIKPCCYSCHQPTYSNCRFYPTPARMINGYGVPGGIYPSPGVLYGGLYNGGLYGGYGGGIYGRGGYNGYGGYGGYGGGLFGGSLLGTGILGSGSSFQAAGGNPLNVDQAAQSSATGNQAGFSSGTVLDIGPISYSSSSSNIGLSILQTLFG